MDYRYRESYHFNVQFEKCQIGIAVVCLIVALLRHIVLKDRRRLWIVPVQPIQNLFNPFRPFRSKVECDAHGCYDEVSVLFALDLAWIMLYEGNANRNTILMTFLLLEFVAKIRVIYGCGG